MKLLNKKIIKKIIDKKGKVKNFMLILIIDNQLIMNQKLFSKNMLNSKKLTIDFMNVIGIKKIKYTIRGK